MSDSPSSRRSPSRERRSQSREKTQNLNIFDQQPNGDKQAVQKELQDELTELFRRYGEVSSLTVKKSRNGEYCFAFVEYKEGASTEEAVRNLNGQKVRGKDMKVEFQDDSKRRKDPEKGCYTCGKKGHFARECHSRNGSKGYRGRSRSRSDSRDRRKRRRRSYSDSSEQHRDRSRHKKSKKHRSKDRDQKKKKKHKKHKHRSSSRSRS